MFGNSCKRLKIKILTSNATFLVIKLFIFYFKVDLSLINDPDQECIYLCGNSLGLQPKTAREYVNRQFDKWEKM